MPVIEEVSAILPQLSTAILPKDKIVPFGYSTAMDRGELLAWIDARLEATGLNDSSASNKAGHRDVIRNLRRARSKPKIEALRALAEVLGEPPPGILDAFEPPPRNMVAVEDLELELDAMRQAAKELENAIEVLKKREKRTG